MEDTSGKTDPTWRESQLLAKPTGVALSLQRKILGSDWEACREAWNCVIILVGYVMVCRSTDETMPNFCLRYV